MNQDISGIFNNLFSPIENKRITGWKKTLPNAEELVKYATKHDKKEPKYIEIYTSVDDNIGIIRTIFIDFDLTTEQRLKWELSHLAQSQVDDEAIKPIIEKGKEDIDKLTDEEINHLMGYFKREEESKINGLTDKEIREYHYNKISNGYLKEPYEEAMKVAEYFKRNHIEVIANWSGSKGLHLRIPLDELIFENEAINHDPKIFIMSLAEIIETTVLNKKIRTSTIDYNVLNRNKGLQRLPLSVNEKSKLYANFIKTNSNYEESVPQLLNKESTFIPTIVDKKENTKQFMKLPIVKEAIDTATTNKTDDNYSEEYANPHYHFNADKGELMKMIKQLYGNGHRNEIGYRIVHVLRRSGFKKEDIEAIFKELHKDTSDEYMETIGGSIHYAFEKDINHLGGVKHLVEGINELKIKNKSNIINYFKENFNYYDKPIEEELDPLNLNDRKIKVSLFENNTDKWVQFFDIFDNIHLKLNFNTLQGNFIKKNIGKDIITFEFTFNKLMFKITKIEENIINDFLKEEDVKLPKLFFRQLNQYFRNIDQSVTSKKELSNSLELVKLFSSSNTPIKNARQKLGHYLRCNGMILRKGINTPYMLDKKTNGYNSVTIDDIVQKLDEYIFNNEDLVHSNDVENALGYIADRQKPKYNIVKFNNCLYDMTNFKVKTTNEEPTFTLIEVAHNYNPSAKGEKVEQFLKTSLAKENLTDEENNELVKGFLEMVGYILTSGNKLNAFFIITGIGGSGKSVASKLISAIFGSEKVGGLQLQELTPDNRFATAHLENKQINIVKDSPSKPIEDSGMLKSITGYDDIVVEPKGKDKYIIPKDEVPDMILVCNNIPKFKEGIEDAFVQRVVLFEFPNQFRGTNKQNPNLENEILQDPEEIEWLIYNGIEAYKEMIKGNGDFKARIDENKTRKLLGKHTNPIPYILNQLVTYSEEDTSIEEPISTKELNNLIQYVAKIEGLAITNINDNGQIKPKYLVSQIRATFELDNEWTTKLQYVAQIEKSVSTYPQLYKKPQYNNWLEKMNNDT